MESDRQRALDVLAEDWGTYIGKFQGLSPQAQAEFLQKQGYKRLADLLAHVVAWWEMGLQSIERYKADPQAKPLEIDVDPFNAKAVEKVRNATDEEVIQTFDAARRRFADYVTGLSDDDFRDERIVGQIRMELIGHYEEHRI